MCLVHLLLHYHKIDLKRIIAFSTCSQLGYMFYSMWIIKLYICFISFIKLMLILKALLFLSAGSIIHALNGETRH